MAVSKGQKSAEGAVRKLYVGVGSSFILGVCPSKAELEKLYGRTQDADPEYLGNVEVNDLQIPQARIDFIVKPNPAKYLDLQGAPIDTIIHAPIFLRRRYVFGASSNKFKVMDKYGRTAWATKEEIETKQIPTYKDKDGNEFKARISPDYIVCYEGLEELTMLIRAYLNIPSVDKWENKKIVGLIDNPSDAEVMPDHIEDIFKGDFKELKEIFGYQPENEVKLPYYVRNTTDGKQYQGVYMKMPLKNSVTDYSKLAKEITESQERGALANCEFNFEEFHEYTITPTSFTPGTPIVMPEMPGTGMASPWGNQ